MPERSYQPGSVLDHYHITQLLGSGGSSHTYLAVDQHTQRQVVLKLPSDEEIGGADIFQRFLREAELGRTLIHPTLQAHLNQDEARSRNYLVLEYLQGYTLREYMHKRAPEGFSPQEAVQLVLALGEALTYVHAQGILHQDIKPENIFVTESGTVKLLDFGISTPITDRSLARHFHVMAQIGTPDYMAPERLLGKHGDVRSDLYSLGLILYELLCGQLPFGYREAFAIVTPQTSDDPPDIRTYRPQLDPALATVVMRTIRRNARKRYQRIADLLHDLTHLDQIQTEAYVPDRPSFSNRYYAILRIALILAIICIFVIGFGFLAQFAHHLPR